MNATGIQAELLQCDPTRVKIALQAIRALDVTGLDELAEGVTRPARAGAFVEGNQG